MDDDKQICFPYAYGRLNASLEWLASGLEMDCICEGIDVDDKVIELLKERIEKIREVSVEESYDKH